MKDELDKAERFLTLYLMVRDAAIAKGLGQTPIRLASDDAIIAAVRHALGGDA